jgi:hypothetical protein
LFEVHGLPRHSLVFGPHEASAATFRAAGVDFAAAAFEVVDRGRVTAADRRGAAATDRGPAAGGLAVAEGDMSGVGGLAPRSEGLPIDVGSGVPPGAGACSSPWIRALVEAAATGD